MDGMYIADESLVNDTERNRWHICTGIGAYIFIAVVDHLASGEDHRDIDRSFAWPAPWVSRSIFAGKDTGVGKRK
jgi:dihydroceramidase